jgi:hypothetical protein
MADRGGRIFLCAWIYGEREKKECVGAVEAQFLVRRRGRLRSTVYGQVRGENALMRRGHGAERRGPFGVPSASLGISPADSNARRTAQLPLALTPLRFAQGRLDSVRMTGLDGVGEDESVEGIH